MESLLNYSQVELTKKLTDLGLEKYRAAQIYTLLQQGKTFDEATNLNKELKLLLNQNFISQAVSIFKSLVAKDGTTKYLFKLEDNNIIEGVLMNYKYGNTLCISTQIGCQMGCLFCASTLDGVVRNLTSAEMLGQVIIVNKLLGGGLNDKRKITNVVLMGSGEPFANYENVTKFLDLIGEKEGLNISQRNISISTCGIVDKMKKLADDGYKVSLTVSLHAPTDEIRKSIMLIARAYSIKDILAASKYYYDITKRKLEFEYILIKDVNDSLECACKLANLVKNLHCHVNLIPLNEIKERDFKTVSKKEANDFLNHLLKNGINASLRRELGDDIQGACGQLRRSVINENK